MVELTAEVLLRKADELLDDQGKASDIIHLCRAASVLYQSVDQNNLAIAALMKIATNLQDNPDFFKDAVLAYEEVASIYEQEGNVEGCSNALMSAAYTAGNVRDDLLASSLFLRASQGYEAVAKSYWEAENYNFAWDNIQLALKCLKRVTEFVDDHH